MLKQWEHKACRRNQQLPGLTKDPLHRMEPVCDAAWVSKSQRLVSSDI